MMLPKSWRRVALKYVLQRTNEALLPSATPTQMFSFVGLENIEAGSGVMRPQRVRGAEILSNKFRFDSGDILYGKLRPALKKVSVAEESGICSTDIWVLRPTPEVLPEFARGLLLSDSFMTRVLAITKGDLPRADSTDFDAIELPLPPLSEQARIVEVLRDAELVRRQQTEAARVAGELIPALFHQMFGDPINAPKRAQKAPIESFVAEFEGGKSLSDEGGSESSPYRVLKISAVTSGVFDPQESKPAPRDTDPALDHFVRKGDVLISRANTAELVGATAMVRENYSNLLLPDKIWRFVFRDPNRQEPEFVYHLFQNPSVRKALSARASGTGGSMKNIGKGRLLSMQIALPAIEEQRRFLALISEIVNSRGNETLAAELHASVLAHAFNGALTAKWRLQNAALVAREAADRDARLARSGVRVSITSALPEETIDSIYATPTDGSWTDLTSRQRALWPFIPPIGAFGVGDLLHVRDKDAALATLSEDGLRRELEVFVARGLLLHVSQPQINSEDERDVFRHYYRKARHHDGEATWNAASVKDLAAKLRGRVTS